MPKRSPEWCCSSAAAAGQHAPRSVVGADSPMAAAESGNSHAGKATPKCRRKGEHGTGAALADHDGLRRPGGVGEDGVDEAADPGAGAPAGEPR